MISIKRFFLAAVAIILFTAPHAVATPGSPPTGKGNGNFLVELLKDGKWERAGQLSFDRFINERRLDLRQYAEPGRQVTVRVTKQGGGAAHLDAVLLGETAPLEVQGENGRLALKKLAKRDNDLLDAAGPIIITFPAVNSGSLLVAGRIEAERIDSTPFQHPLTNLYQEITDRSSFLSYRLGSNSGPISAEQFASLKSKEALFNELAVSGSGHPSGQTYGWVRNDSKNLYVYIDFTPDNTMDGDKDYAAVYARTASGIKQFKVSEASLKWGQPYFIYTDKVGYQHKFYSFSIPLSELGITPKEEKPLQLAFATYGTAAPQGVFSVVPALSSSSKVYYNIYFPAIGNVYNHTATLLRDGTILITGGQDEGGSPLQLAAIYNPANSSFTTLTAMLNAPRAGHTATMLLDGRVLIVGGGSTSMELYDPAKQSFTPVSGTIPNHTFASATLLKDGRVLVAGGGNADTTIYTPDSGSGSFVSTPTALIDPRSSHTATLLGDGRVVLIGGGTSKAQLFDPNSGDSITLLIDDARLSRDAHTSTLLTTGQILVAGGNDGGSGYSALLLDQGGNITDLGSMNNGHINHTATLLPNGKVLLAGGTSEVGQAELFDPAFNSFASQTSMNGLRTRHTATLLPGGKVLFVGGGSNSAEQYRIDNWSNNTSLNWNHNGCSMQASTPLPNGMLLLTGGYMPGRSYCNSTLFYQPAYDQLVAGPYLTRPREGSSATLLASGKVLICGGYNNNSYNIESSCEILDPQSNVSLLLPATMDQNRLNHSATLLADGRVLLTGGSGDYYPEGSAIIFDPYASSFSAPIPLVVPRRDHSATLLKDGRVLIAGGSSDGSSPLNSAEIFDPRGNSGAGAFTLTGSMSIPSADHTATLLADGRVLIAGGSSDYDTANSIGQLFDPVNGSFTPTSGVLDSTFCSGHMEGSALPLPDGRVLLAGGYCSGWSNSQTAEVYDPVSDSFKIIASYDSSFGEAGRMILTQLDNGRYLLGNEGVGYLLDPNIGIDNNRRLRDLAPTFTSSGGLSLTSGTPFDFFGDSEGSSGNSSSSATNYPLLSLRHLQSGSSYQLPADPTAGNTRFNLFSQPLGGIPLGFYSATIHVGGVASLPQTIRYDRSLIVAPGQFDFGNVGTGQQSSPATFQISNNGTLPIVISGVGIKDQPAYYPYNIFSNNCGPLAPGESCSVSITFTPVSGSLEKGTLYIESSDVAQPTLTIPLSGTGIPNPKTLTINVTGSGGGTVNASLGGIIFGSCSSSCSYPVTNGANVVLTPVVPQTSSFVSWSGAGSGTATRTVTIGNSQSVTADFVANRLVTTINPVQGGAVSPGDVGYISGQPQTIKLYPATGYHVAGLTIEGNAIPFASLTAEGNGVYSYTYTPTQSTSTVIASFSSGNFIEASSSVYNRRQATVMLNDGRILLTGGYSGNTARTSADLYDPASGSTSSTGLLNTARAEHSAILLGNGKVLITGGKNDANLTIASAELYDPASGTFSTLASGMNASRDNHTMSLLPDGRVLIAGGYNGSNNESSAEIYDPADDSFTSTSGAMNSPRSNHTATMLPNGKVLLAGGNNDSGAVSAADIYDPVSSNFSATATDMTVARSGHSATLLTSGKVLLAGGTDAATNWLNSAELFDPNNSTTPFETISATMSDNRTMHSAILLPDGKVLLAGGIGSVAAYTADSYDPVANSFNHAGNLAYPHSEGDALLLPSGRAIFHSTIFYIYDTSRNSALFPAVTGTMASGRRNHSATLLPDGKLLLAGGMDGNNNRLNSGELYTQGSGFSAVNGTLQEGRNGSTATLLNDGRVLIVGGDNGSSTSNKADLYNSASGLAQADGGGTLLAASGRNGHTATLLNDGTVLITGGGDINAEIYQPGTGFTSAGAFSQGYDLAGHSATLLNDGRVLIAGGLTKPLNSYSSLAMVYDPASRTFSNVGSMTAPRSNHSATLLADGKVLISGGNDGNSERTDAELFDPRSNSFISVSSNLSAAHPAQRAIRLRDGRVLLAGGQSQQLDIYDPAGNIFYSAGTLASNRDGCSVTMLPDGSILLIGGGSGAELTTPLRIELEPNYPASRRPQVSTVNAIAGKLEITGTGLRGDAEVSFGRSASSSMAFPLAKLQSLDNSQSYYIQPDPSISWNASSFTSVLPATMPNGYYFFTLSASGVPSTATIVSISHALLAMPTSYNYGIIGINGAKDATFILLNQGTNPVYISNTMLSNSSDFAIISDNCYDSTLNQGSSCTLTVRFSALSTGDRSGVLTIDSDAADTPKIDIPLAGSGRNPVLTVNISGNTSQYFGNISMQSYSYNWGWPFYAQEATRSWNDIPFGANITLTPNPYSYGGFYFSSSNGCTQSGISCNPITVSNFSLTGDTTINYTLANDSVASDYNLSASTPEHGSITLNPTGGRYIYGTYITATINPAPGYYFSRLVNSVNSADLTGDVVYNNGVIEYTFNIYNDTNLVATFNKYGVIGSTTGREYHTATQLQDGRLLVAGGEDSRGGMLRSIDIYDPAVNQYISRQMTTARKSHSATLLTDGTVLLLGGNSGTQALGSAEIFDPKTNTVTLLGNTLNYPREGHTATLLRDGRVLIAGGARGVQQPDGSFLYEVHYAAEVYNPSDQSFSYIADMNWQRIYHAATLLQNGQVLITGGWDGNNTLDSAELFDPYYESFNTTYNSMNYPHDGHTATLLASGDVLIVGGDDGYGYYNNAELYITGSDYFNDLSYCGPTMRSNRDLHSATLLPDGRVLLAGGWDGTGATASTEIYDPNASSSYPFSLGPELATPQLGQVAMMTPGGRIVLVGGWDGTKSIDTVETLTIPIGSTSANNDYLYIMNGSLNSSRISHTVTPLDNGVVFVAGGNGEKSTELLVTSDGWYFSYGLNMAYSRDYHTATRLTDGRVLLAGGYGSGDGGFSYGDIAPLEFFDYNSNSITTGPSLATPRDSHSATLLNDGRVLIAGGVDDSGNPLASLELYDPSSNSLTALGFGLNTPRADHSATLLADGRVLIAGGTQDFYGGLNSVEIIDLNANSSTEYFNATTLRYQHTATLLPDGNVLLAGGWDADSRLASYEIIGPLGNLVSSGLLSNARANHSATILPDGRVWLAGGSDGDANGIATASDIFDPFFGDIVKGPNLVYPRTDHRALTMTDGTVMLVGGQNLLNVDQLEFYTPFPNVSGSYKPYFSNQPTQTMLGSNIVLDDYYNVRFSGVSDGSGGGQNNSSGGFPQLSLQRVDNGQRFLISATNWSGDYNYGSGLNTYSSVPLVGLPAGPYAMSVIANGIASDSTMLLLDIIRPQVSGGNGTISCTPLNFGAPATCTTTPAPGFITAIVDGCGGTLSGNTYTITSVPTNCYVGASFAPVNTLDPTFAGNGHTVLNGGSNGINYSWANGVAVQADNKVVAVGIGNNGSGEYPLVVRYNSDGSLDSSFIYNYADLMNMTGNSYGKANDVIIQGDGKIVVIGDTNNIMSFVVRLNQDGSIDNTFNSSSGIYLFNFGSSTISYGVALQADGKILITGDYSGAGNTLFMLRLNSDGTVDMSDFEGYVSYYGSNNSGMAIAVQNDGKIVITGSTLNGPNVDLLLLRYNSNGTLDSSFNGSGVVTYNGTGNGNDYGNGVAIQPDDNKIVVTGSTFTGANNELLLLRYNPDGTLDNTFNGTGIITYSEVNGAYGNDVAILADGRILVAGSSNFPDRGALLALLYNKDGSIDSSYANNGVFSYFDIFQAYGYTMRLAPDGSVVIAGERANSDWSIDELLVVRLQNPAKPKLLNTGINNLANFDNGLPTGWLVKDNTGFGGWRFDDPAGRGNLTGGSGGFAIADSENICDFMDAELVSSAYDLSGLSTAILEFKTDFYYGGYIEVADVDISIDGGSSWTNVWSQSGADFRGPATVQLDISAKAAGQGNVKVRFHYYNANCDWWWQVDDVRIYGSPLFSLTAATTATGAGSGTIRSSLAGISCGSAGTACSSGFPQDYLITLTASPDSGSWFNGWSGDCSGVQSLSCTLTMDKAKNVNADFTDIQPTSQTWSVTLGGSGYEEAVRSFQDADGNYFAIGYTDSYGLANSGDGLLLKYAPDGTLLWDKWFGTTYYEWINDARPTADKGLIVAGESNSDGWLAKLDKDGNILWNYSFNGLGYDYFDSVSQTAEGGYIASGYSDGAAIVIKLTSNGVEEWHRFYGSAEAYNIQQTLDNCYILTGYQGSNSWLMKLDSDGSKIWEKLTPLPSSGGFNNVQQTYDGGYITAGSLYGLNYSNSEAWVVKYLANGDIDWQNVYNSDPTNNSVLNTIKQTGDGYIVSGYLNSDALLLKLNSDGSVNWQKTFGGFAWDYGSSVNLAADGGYIMTGSTGELDGNGDAWLLKLDGNGNATGCQTWLQSSSNILNGAIPAIINVAAEGTIIPPVNATLTVQDLTGVTSGGTTGAAPYYSCGGNVLMDGILTATPGNRQINLAWSNFTGAIDHFVLSSSTTDYPADCSSGTTIAGTALNYSDGSANQNQTYYYRLCAYNAGGSSTSGAVARAIPSNNQAGSVDQTFNTPVGVNTSNDSSDNYPVAAARQSDGKVLVTGDIGRQIMIRRFSSAGIQEQSYTPVVPPVYFNSTTARNHGKAIKVQNDDKAVVAYSYIKDDFYTDYHEIARYDANGNLDTASFKSPSGKVSLPAGYNVSDLVIDSSGRIIAIGENYSGGMLLRLNSDGSNDTGFNGTGEFIIGAGNHPKSGFIQPDGKIVLTGFDDSGNSKVWRILADGTAYDTGFGSGGSALLSGSSAKAYRTASQSDGKIVVSGYAADIETYENMVWRLNIDGTTDTTFNSPNGYYMYYSNIGSFLTPEANGLAIQADDRIIVSGYQRNVAGDLDALVLRFNNDGSLDGNFGFGGVFSYDGPWQKDDFAAAVLLQPDSNIILAGASSNGTINQTFVIRLIGSNPLLPPATVNAVPGNGWIYLTWDPVPGATSYNIYRSTVSGQQGVLIGNSTVNSYLDNTVVNGTVYYYTVTSMNGGSESIAATAISSSPNRKYGHFAYISNSTGQVTAYAVNPNSGAIVSIGSYNTDGDTDSLTVDPLGRFVYATNATPATVAAFKIDQATGALTSAGTVSGVGTYPDNITVDPQGKFAYVADGWYSGPLNLYIFAIDQTTGALSPAGSVPISTTSNFSIAIDPTGRFAYVASDNSNSGAISIFSIDKNSGGLTPAGTVPIGTGSLTSIAIDPTGRYLYTTDRSSNSRIWTYSINQNSGALNPAGSGFVGTGAGSYGVTVDPSGRFVYAASNADSTVSSYTIQTDGSLVATGTTATGTAVVGVSTDPTGSYLYAANAGDNTVSVYVINGDGTLAPVSGSPFSAGSAPNSVAFAAYTTLPTPPLSVTRSGSGSGSVISQTAGINCGSTCTASFNYGSMITLTAYPDPGSYFTGWTGPCTGGSGSQSLSCMVTMDSAKSVTADFASGTATATSFIKGLFEPTTSLDGRSVQQTADGGYIVAGQSSWPVSTVVAKYNASGAIEWQKSFAKNVASSYNYVRSIKQTGDGGYILAGSTFNGTTYYDPFVMKLDASGNQLWQKTYANGFGGDAGDIIPTSDGGYVLTGSGNSAANGFDLVVLKLDGNGAIQWQTSLVTSSTDGGSSIRQTGDGGYIIAGQVMNMTSYNTDFAVIKLNQSGQLSWQKTFSGPAGSTANSIRPTSDGGYVIAGDSVSNITWNRNAVIMKLDASGNIQWQKPFTWQYTAYGYDAQEMNDGSFAFLVETSGGGGTYLLRLDNNGNTLWQSHFPNVAATSLQQTMDNGFAISGISWIGNLAYDDLILIKTDANGQAPQCMAGNHAQTMAAGNVTLTANAVSAAVAGTPAFTAVNATFNEPAMSFTYNDYCPAGSNLPPAAPVLAAPTNSISNLTVSGQQLQWNYSSDPNYWDQVVYDIYMDQSSTPTTQIASGLASNYYNLPTLNPGTTYYWQVVARDLSGATAASSIWSFTTLQLLTLVTSGNGSIKSSISGIDCGTTCSAYFQQNSIIKLTATPAAGSYFNGWSGGCTSQSISCSVTLDAAKTVTADFTTTPPALQTWAMTYGAGAEWADSIQQTSDGGYIFAGTSYTTDPVGGDGLVVKLSSSGSIEWQKSYGASGTTETLQSIQQRADGGYIAAGYKGAAAWILKLNSDGTVVWDKEISDGSNSFGNFKIDIQQTADAGYVLTTSHENVSISGWDAWVCKLNSDGSIAWQKTYGANGTDSASVIRQTADGGFIIGGGTSSSAFGATNGNLWFIKLDSNGSIIWENRFFRLDYSPTVFALETTTDGGYIATGSTYLTSGGGYEGWILKLNSDGSTAWQKNWGSSLEEHPHSVAQTFDGGYIIAGNSGAGGALLKLANDGTLLWEKKYSLLGTLNSVRQTADRGYVAAGFTAPGTSDAWVLKLDETGEIIGCPGGTITTLTTAVTDIDIAVVVPIATNATVTDTTAISSDVIPVIAPVTTTFAPVTVCTGLPTIFASAGANGSISPNGATPVASGGSQTISITPAAGYHVADVLVDGSSVGSVTSYTFPNVTTSHTISASFANSPPVAYPQSQSVQRNGSLAITLTGSDPEGSSLTFAVDTATVNGTLSGTAPNLTYTPAIDYIGPDSFTFTVSDGVNPAASATVSITVTQWTRMVTFTAGANGSISGISPQSVTWNGDATSVTATANSGYHFVNWTDSLSSFVSTTATLSLTSITADMNLTASFAPNSYTVTISPTTNGTASGPSSFLYGAQPLYTFTPATGYRVAGVTVNGVSVGAVSSYRLPANTIGPVTITATFSYGSYRITATVSGANGRISPASANISNGADYTATITPNAGYQIDSLTDNGTAVEAIPGTRAGTFIYKITGVTATHAIVVTFKYAADGDLTMNDGNPVGTITIADPLKALQIAIGEVVPTPQEVLHGDVAPIVNGKPAPDGKIDIGDVVVLLRKLLGLVNW